MSTSHDQIAGHGVQRLDALSDGIFKIYSSAKSETGFAVFAFILISAMSYGLAHVFSGRAAYIHVGAVFGTFLALNVWMRILPAQRRLIAASQSGATIDPALASQAKLRSKHNTFMAVPVVFIMVSNHYPVAT